MRCEQPWFDERGNQSPQMSLTSITRTMSQHSRCDGSLDTSRTVLSSPRKRPPLLMQSLKTCHFHWMPKLKPMRIMNYSAQSVAFAHNSLGLLAAGQAHKGGHLTPLLWPLHKRIGPETLVHVVHQIACCHFHQRPGQGLGGSLHEDAEVRCG